MYLKVSEAAKLARASRGRIYAAIRRGWFYPVPDVPYVCLRQEDVEAFRDRTKPKGGRSQRVLSIQCLRIYVKTHFVRRNKFLR